MIPIIRTKILPSIEVMHEIALRYICDKMTVSYMDEKVLEEGICEWCKKTALTKQETWGLKRIVNALRANEKGFFNRAKEQIIRMQLDYHKYYSDGLPYIPDSRFDGLRGFGKP